MDGKTDPVIIDLLRWLKDNLPPDTDEDAIFKKEFYNHAMSLHQEPNKEDNQTVATLEDTANSRLKEMREYINLNSEKQVKTKKLNQSRAKLDLKKEQYQLINSIRLDGCMDLISRYNHLISKK